MQLEHWGLFLGQRICNNVDDGHDVGDVGLAIGVHVGFGVDVCSRNDVDDGTQSPMYVPMKKMAPDVFS